MMSRRARGRMLGALALGPLLALVALVAQPTRRLPGFGMAYVPPSGWTLAGAEGRIEAWSRPAGDGALIVYGGAYSSGPLALAGGASVLEGAQLGEATTVVEAPAQRTVNGVECWSTTVRAPAQSGESVIVRFLARPAGDGMMFGIVTVASPSADADVRAAAEALVRTVRADVATRDLPAERALVGAWRWQESTMSSTGGMVSEEGWDLSPDGTFEHRTASTVTLPGAAVPPERTRQTGRWQVIGGGLVVHGQEGTTTLYLKQTGRVADIGGRRFLRR
jgi:hypothetical protein